MVPVGETSSVIIYSSDDGNGIPVVDGVVTLPGFVLVQPKASLTLDMTLAPEGDPASGQDFKDLPSRSVARATRVEGLTILRSRLRYPLIRRNRTIPILPRNPRSRIPSRSTK